MSRGIVHRLGSDDIVDPGFLIKDNANTIIDGLTDNATSALGVAAGGTGGASFTDGEFITYSSTQKRFISSGVSLPDTYSKAQMDSFFASHTGGKYQVAYSEIANPPTLQVFTETSSIPTSDETILFSTMDWIDPDFWTVRLKCIANTVAHLWTIGDRIELWALMSNDSSGNVIRHAAFLDSAGARIGVTWTAFTSYIVKKGGGVLSISNANLALNFEFEATARKFTV